MIDDPHWWNSVANVEKATVIVRDELIKLDPANRADCESNAESYLAKLGELDKWAKRKVAELPRDKRKLVTSHDPAKEQRARKAADPDKIRPEYGKDGVFICYDYPTANP